MNLSIRVKGTNRESEIDWKTLSIDDEIDDRINTCRFTINKYKTSTVIPKVGEEVLVYDGANKIFAGTILRTERGLKGAKFETISVDAEDYTHNLGRSLIVEKYADKTVNQIIADLLSKYHTDFTDDYVNCTITIKTITFNNVSVLEAIQKLSAATNYRWYVDYDKKVHFFAKGSETSPFNLTDTNGKYIFKSLVLRDDISQLRNSVKIRGGDIVGVSRTELFSGDDQKLIFALSNKFSEMPTVTVSGTPQSVGAEHLAKEEDYNCFWNFNEKYVRFSSSATPVSGTNNIVIVGTPLIPIIVRKMNKTSINQYGRIEFYKRDATIRSKEEAAQYAEAELSAYANSIVEGSFETYESGLESGQVINIQSTIRDIDENFLIQSVQLKMRTPSDGFCRVELATMRTIGIIDFLIDLLQTERRIVIREQEQEPILTYYDFEDEFKMADGIGTPITTSTPYYWWPETGDGINPPVKWNLFVWSP